MSNNPIVLFENLLAGAQTVPDAGLPLTDDDTTVRWLPDDTDTLEFLSLPASQISHVGIAAHNLGTTGGSFLIETGDGTTWSTLATLSASDDQAFMVEVGPVVADGIRITAQGEGLQLGILYVGEALQFERSLYQGHTPIVFSDANTRTVKKQAGGQFLGNTVRRRSRATSVRLSHLTPQFVRSRMEPFRQHYNDGGRFFFSWRPEKYASDAIYAEGEGTIQIVNSGPAAFMSAEFRVSAYVQTYRPEFILPPAPPEPGPEPTEWTPAQITTALWLDADDATTYTVDGSNVATEWQDKSGNGFDVDGPLLAASQIDGKNTFRINATYPMDFVSPFTTSTNSYAWFYVVRPLAQTANGGHWRTGTINPSGNSFNIYVENDFFPWLRAAGADVLKPTSGWKVEFDTNQIIEWEFVASDSATVLESGDSKHTTSHSNAGETLAIYRFGDHSNSVNDLDSYYGEIIAIDGTITNGDRQKLEGYLAWKWGLEGRLPAGHPYKSGAPTV